jgi:putative intracellular protease/amidase
MTSQHPSTVLLALSSHSSLGDTGKPTGYYVPEAAHPWQIFRDAGYRVELVSPQGGKPPEVGFDADDPVQRAFLEDEEVAGQLAQTPRPADLSSDKFRAIYFVGGHGTMWDFPDDVELATLARGIYESGGVVAAVCHGPAALVNLTLSDGVHLVDGKEVASFTDEEESRVGLTGVVPFLLESTLRNRGAKHIQAEPFAPHVVVSERLVTGQNPASAAGVATEVVRLLG